MKTKLTNKRAHCRFKLFVAGDEQNSKNALNNLEKLCSMHPSGTPEIEIVDVFTSPGTALENGIFLTPALIRISPSPQVTIFGDLSDEEDVIKSLGLE